MNLGRLRLRPMQTVRLYSYMPVYRRLTDKSHRSHYASLKKESSRRSAPGRISIKPSVRYFLVWLHHKKEGRLTDLWLPKDGLPSHYTESTVLEMLVFHILTCLYTTPADEEWLKKQEEHLGFLNAVFSGSSTSGKKMKYTSRSHSSQDITHSHDVTQFFWLFRSTMEFYANSDVSDVSEVSANSTNSTNSTSSTSSTISDAQCRVLNQALVGVSLACPSVKDISMLLPWLRSLSAPTVSQACSELSELSDIPAFVTSDILLRSPMEVNEFRLQLELWSLFMGDIAKTYHSKSRASPVPTILQNLTVSAINWNCSDLPSLVDTAVAFFCSTQSGYKFNIFHAEFCNELLFGLAFAFVKNGSPSHCMTPIIKTQANLVKFLTNEKLSQDGYLGIVLTISCESSTKAQKLFETALSLFPVYTSRCALTKVYLSSTIEELIHHFNEGVSQFPQSSILWMMLIKKLIFFELLTEKRAHKLLQDLVKFSDRLVISKEIILDLLSSVNTIHGIETFIKTLSQGQLLPQFRNSILIKYMSLLYKYSDQPSIYKPYLNGLFPGGSNLNCARKLYQQIQWKTATTIGIMLNGEVNHRPQDIFSLYEQETQTISPTEASLNALLRASLKKPNGKPLLWGEMFASQIAVHEFKLNVAKNVASLQSGRGLILPSDKLWKSYIKCLTQADYVSELADIIRWWEELQFQPKKSTLVLLLRGLPREFVERHIKHARAAGKNNEFLLAWPWPGSDEIDTA